VAKRSYARPLVYQGEAEQELQAFLDRTFEFQPHHAVLDVGCGFVLPIDVPLGVRLVGLDNDPDALAKNTNIDEAIVAHIHEASLPEEEFDAVLCWNVLEHLPRPNAALARMTQTLRPGGALIIGMPNPRSLKGLITRLTPYRFHVWVYRRLFGLPDAGTPGHGPYRTYLGRDLAPPRFTDLAATLKLEKIYEDSYGRVPPLPRLLRAGWAAVAWVGRTLSLGRWDPLESDVILVFRKTPRDT
jgi:SAM-dependent methyltransferase